MIKVKFNELKIGDEFYYLTDTSHPNYRPDKLEVKCKKLTEHTFHCEYTGQVS